MAQIAYDDTITRNLIATALAETNKQHEQPSDKALRFLVQGCREKTILSCVDPSDLVNGAYIVGKGIDSIGNGSEPCFPSSTQKVDLTSSNATEIESHALEAIQTPIVNLPKNIQLVHNLAFLNCKKLKVVNVFDTQTQIEPEAFLGCNKNLVIRFPDNTPSDVLAKYVNYFVVGKTENNQPIYANVFNLVNTNGIKNRGVCIGVNGENSNIAYFPDKRNIAKYINKTGVFGLIAGIIWSKLPKALA